MTLDGYWIAGLLYRGGASEKVEGVGGVDSAFSLSTSRIGQSKDFWRACSRAFRFFCRVRREGFLGLCSVMGGVVVWWALSVGLPKVSTFSLAALLMPLSESAEDPDVVLRYA